jgi:uncharacterized protein YbjT (DUF2867 family)
MNSSSKPRSDSSSLSVAVAGSTGVVGRHVVTALERQGHRVRLISRAHGVDLLEKPEIVDAVDGVDAVIDVANVVTTGARASTAFFTRAATNLVEACQQRAVPRYVLLSIVGVDRVRQGYYLGKLEQERLVQHSELEHVVLRATQFHEFAAQMWDRMRRGPVVMAPRMRCAPVSAQEVAERLTELAVAARPAPLLEMGGPEALSLPEMMRAWGKAAGRQAALLPVPVPGAGGRAMREGGLLPARPQFVGEERFGHWLARTHPRRSVPQVGGSR